VKLIVADSGPLIVLTRAGLLKIVSEIAGDILVPEAVFFECTHEARKPGAAAIVEALKGGLFSVADEAAVGALPALQKAANLGAGEMSAIALAIDRNCPVLMDERLGRNVASRYGLTVIGSVGILLAAKRRNLIAAIAPILSEWGRWGYFLSPSLVETALSAAGEKPDMSA
jgi:hypothetical protein